MPFIKIDTNPQFDSDIFLKPDKLDIDDWVDNLGIYTGSKSPSPTLKWLAFIKFSNSESFQKKFKIPDVLDVDFSRTSNNFELTTIIEGLIKKGQYKKYFGVWNWVSELQEILLTEDWNKIKKRKDTLYERPVPRATRRRAGLLVDWGIALPTNVVVQPPASPVENSSSFDFHMQERMLNSMRNGVLYGSRTYTSSGFVPQLQGVQSIPIVPPQQQLNEFDGIISELDQQF